MIIAISKVGTGRAEQRKTCTLENEMAAHAYYEGCKRAKIDVLILQGPDTMMAHPQWKELYRFGQVFPPSVVQDDRRREAYDY